MLRRISDQMLQTLPTGIWERDVPHAEAGEHGEAEGVNGVSTGHPRDIVLQCWSKF